MPRSTSGCDSRQPHQSGHAGRQLAQPSLQNSACSGQHRDGVPIIPGVVADKQCTCLASKPMWERYPPIPPFSINCGENQIQVSFISSTSVGATPTPATISFIWEMIRQPGCNPDVIKSVGSDDWSVTSISHQPLPLKTRPGKPFRIRSSISGGASARAFCQAINVPLLGAGPACCKSLRVRQFQNLP